MELTTAEKKIQDEAIAYLKQHEDELIHRFVIAKNPLRVGYATLFMAGSPGAGKTEFSQRYIPIAINKKDQQLKLALRKIHIDITAVDCVLIRIDADEIREFFPQYQKTDMKKGIHGNAHIIQKAANKGLDMVRDYCLANNISFLHDGTFGNYGTMKKIVQKSLVVGREIQIFYLYLDPVTAWQFTKAREYLEGRNIVKEKFIDQYFNARENVDRIKREFGDTVKINCVLKDSDNTVKKIEFNLSRIDRFLDAQYHRGILKRYTREELFDLIF